MVKNSCLAKMSLRKVANYFLVVGMLCLLLGVFIAIVIPKIIETKITEQTRLINNSETFFKWKNPDLPIFIRFYFYNVTNPDDVINGNQPIFDEIGPIVYQERRLKEVDDIDTEADTLTFRQSITYTFKPDLSSLSEEEIVTAINMPLVGISKKGFNLDIVGGALRESLHEYMDKHPGEVKLFIRRTVKQLLYEGYYDPLLQELAEISGKTIFPNHTFGIYVGKNGTFGSSQRIDAGVKNYQNFGKVVAVNGVTEMSHWNNEFCSRLNGSDGSLFPPFVTKDRIIRIFSEDACRSIFMTFQKEIDYFGVTAYRFHLPPEIWASGESYPDNMCFCPNKDKCSRSGIMDISPCKEGAPVFASMPHFLYGDDKLLNSSRIAGPKIEKDETYLDIEPITGMLLGAMKRFQVNMDLFPNKKVRGFRKVPHMVFPVLWGEEFFISTKDRADMLNSKLLNPLKFVAALRWFSFIFGLLCIFSGSICLLLRRNRRKEIQISQQPNKLSIKSISGPS